MYRPKSEAFLRKSPSATIGNFIRFDFQKERLKSASSPGPGQYDLRSKRPSGPRACFTTARELNKTITPKYVTPGPLDYCLKIEAILKNNPKATIGRGNIEYFLTRDKINAPSPQHYRVNKHPILKKAPVVIFNRARREDNNANLYMKTYNVPSQVYHKFKKYF